MQHEEPVIGDGLLLWSC